MLRKIFARLLFKKHRDKWHYYDEGGWFYVVSITRNGHYEGWHLSSWNETLRREWCNFYQLEKEVKERDSFMMMELTSVFRNRNYDFHIVSQQLSIEGDKIYYTNREGVRIPLWEAAAGFLPAIFPEEKKLNFCLDGMPALCTKEGVFTAGERMSFDVFLKKYPDCQEVIDFKNEL